jgi:hypothetical protein
LSHPLLRSKEFGGESVADLDGDGIPDLLATDAVSVLVLLQAEGVIADISSDRSWST